MTNLILRCFSLILFLATVEASAQGGYQPEFSQRAYQQGVDRVNQEQLMQQQQLLNQLQILREIEQMKQLQRQREANLQPGYSNSSNQGCSYSTDCPGDFVCNRFNRCVDPSVENWEGERIAR